MIPDNAHKPPFDDTLNHDFQGRVPRDENNPNQAHFWVQGLPQRPAQQRTKEGQAISVLEQLVAESGLSKQQLKEAAQKGCIWIRRHPTQKPQRLRRLKVALKANQQVDFYYYPALLNKRLTPPTLISDQTTFSVWLKPRGMPSQGSKWGDHTTLYRWVEQNYTFNEGKRQTWLVHRLDQATHGLMLLAHSKAMASYLSALFAHNKVHKTYQAWVHGHFKTEQTLTLNTPIEGKQACTHASLLQACKHFNISQLSVHIESGRKHQIRRHLAEAGYALVGDRLYGDENLDRALTTKAHWVTRPDLQLSATQLILEPDSAFHATQTNRKKALNLEEMIHSSLSFNLSATNADLLECDATTLLQAH